MNLYKKYSIQQGLIVPDSEACKTIAICSKEAPGLHEQALAARQHRWKEMREIQEDFFEYIMTQVEEAEIQWINILNFPNINDIRMSFSKAPNDIFTVNKAQLNAVESSVDEMYNDVLNGEIGLDHYALLAFSVSLQKNRALIQRLLPEGMIVPNVPPDINNRYLQAIIRDATKRIRTLSKNQKKQAREALIRMAKENKTPLDAARWMHQNIGEGKAWRYLRVARSEAVLAAGAGYDAQAYEAEINYDVWSAASGACYICSAFDGEVWPRGRGPQPVSDTHPHCCCYRYPQYTTDRPVNKPWNRESPYDTPYTRDEINRIFL